MTEKTLDQKIVEISEVIAKQKALVESEGKRAESKWSTTGVLHINGLKLTIQVANEEQIVSGLAELILKEEAHSKAAKMLNSKAKFKFDGHEIEKWRADMETRLAQIKYKKSKEKLETLESRLKSIMSEDTKRSMEFDAIMKELNE
jgi:hypothetical protein